MGLKARPGGGHEGKSNALKHGLNKKAAIEAQGNVSSRAIFTNPPHLGSAGPRGIDRANRYVAERGEDSGIFRLPYEVAENSQKLGLRLVNTAVLGLPT
jgi:hypothetical protein